MRGQIFKESLPRIKKTDGRVKNLHVAIHQLD